MIRQPRRRAAHIKRIPPRTASPILKAIFNAMLDREIRVADMADMISKGPNRLSEYRCGRVEPGIMTVEEMAAALGCRLVLEPIEKSSDTPLTSL